MGRKSQLKSNVIEKVWLNRKNYKFLDFEFKVTDIIVSKNYNDDFNISIYNCGVLILKLEVDETKEKEKERFFFKVKYFNPQTDNDCFSINHIIAVCSEYTRENLKIKDMGNAEIIKNQFILRKKDNYYTYVKIWVRGDVKSENYDKRLSYEFATDEYLNYVKKIFNIKRLQKRTIKKHFKGHLDKIIIVEGLK